MACLFAMDNTADEILLLSPQVLYIRTISFPLVQSLTGTMNLGILLPMHGELERGVIPF